MASDGRIFGDEGPTALNGCCVDKTVGRVGRRETADSQTGRIHITLVTLPFCTEAKVAHTGILHSPDGGRNCREPLETARNASQQPVSALCRLFANAVGIQAWSPHVTQGGR